jgi:hypothetical protein
MFSLKAHLKSQCSVNPFEIVNLWSENISWVGHTLDNCVDLLLI